jgi:hypothetical protein
MKQQKPAAATFSGATLPRRPASMVDLTGRYLRSGEAIRDWRRQGVFPEPVACVGTANIWDLEEIEEYEHRAIATGRTTGFPHAAVQAQKANA